MAVRPVVNIPPVSIASLRRFLALELTLAEWLGIALMLAVPYVAVGVAYAVVDADRWDGATGIAWCGRLTASVLAWPALIVTGGCVA